MKLGIVLTLVIFLLGGCASNSIERSLMNAESTVSESKAVQSAIFGNIDSNRIAIVIGNNDYPNAPLRNAAQDAFDISNKIAAADYKVVRLIDVEAAQISEALNQIEPNRFELALIYYAGHAVEFEGINYGLSAGASYSSFDDVSKYGFDFKELINIAAQKGIETNIVVIDACRDFPFIDGGQLKNSERLTGRRERNGGLSRLIAPANTLVAYSTSPGFTASDGLGENGPYATALLAALDENNQPFERVFQNVRSTVWRITDQQQVPWSTSSIISEDACFQKPCRGGSINSMISERFPIGLMARSGATAPDIKRLLDGDEDSLIGLLSLNSHGRHVVQRNVLANGVRFDFGIATITGGVSNRADSISLMKLENPQARLTIESVEESINFLDGIDGSICFDIDWGINTGELLAPICRITMVVGRRENADPEALARMKSFNQNWGKQLITYNSLDEMAQDSVRPPLSKSKYRRSRIFFPYN